MTSSAASSTPFTDPHVVAAHSYAEDVSSGRIPACRWVRLACTRQLGDLERFAGEDSSFVFSEREAGRVCRFIEHLPHIKGPLANLGQLLRLEPWQAFILVTAFGWRRRDTGGRRFRRVYIEVPRGNGKSALSSAVGLYGLGGENEEGAEVYAAATTKAQAKIVWGVAKQMLRRVPALCSALGLKTGKEVITHARTNSVFAPMTRDADSQEGQNIHLAVIDELHAHPTREIWDVVETATSKRPSSMTWAITTAGKDTAGICYEVRSYLTKILTGELEDETQFGVIYSIDEGDDWKAPETWRKANPNWGISIDAENFAALANKAGEVASARSNFLRKHLDVWVGADESWMDLEAWDRCADPTLRPDDFLGDRCDLGLDLASKVDIAAKTRLFSRVVEGEQHYYLFLDAYLPEAAITDSRNSQYAGWVEEGRIVTTPGNVLDFGRVRADVLADAKRFRVHEVAFDPWQATQLGSELLAKGVPMVELQPSVKNFSEPMKELAALVLQGRLHHDGNPVLRWMVTNVICHSDAKDNIYPRKERVEQKIDGVVAALMALNRALVPEAPPPPRNPYESRGMRFL